MNSKTTSSLLNWLKQKTAATKNSPENDAIGESLLANILENAAEVIIMTDEAQRILSFNKNAEQVFGYTAEEIIGKPLDVLIPSRFSEAHREHVKRFAEGHRQSHFMHERQEIYGLRKNGEEFPAEASITKSSVTGAIIFSVFLRDISNRKRAEMETRLLIQLAHIIIESKSFDSALDQALRAICEDTGWDFGEVWLLSTNGKYLELGNPWFSQGQGLEDFRRKSEGITLASGVGLPGQVWLSKQAIWVPDICQHDHLLRKDASHEAGLKAAVGIPILAGDVIVAVMVFFMKQTRQEDERIVKIVSSIAMQLGMAFQRRQADGRIKKLYNALEQSAATIKKRLRESEALAKITRSLSEAEHVGLENLLELIATSAKELIVGAEQAVIHLLDEQEQALIPKAVAGLDVSQERKQTMRLGEGIAGHAIESADIINISDVESDSRFLNTGSSPTFRSLMVAPIISGERKFGTISVQSKIPYAFLESDGSLLRELGNQAAIALENARLLENTRQALKETNALYHINRGLNALNVDELLNDAVELLKTNFDYYHVQVYIVDPKSGDLILRAASGDIGRQLCERRHHLRAGTGIVGYAAEIKSPFFTNNVDEILFFIRNPFLPETKAEMAIPIQSGEKLLGILDIQQTDHKLFTERDVHLVSAVADQLAIAFHQAELYENLQTSLKQEKAIRNQLVQNERLTIMGRLLASVSHELNNPLQAIHNALFLLKEEKGISELGRQDLEIVLAESERMAAMIERLRTTYRPTQAEDFKPTQVNHLIEDVHALISTHLRRSEIAFIFHPDPTLPYIYALSDQLRQVFLNLFMNAVEAMTSGGSLNVRTKYLSESNEIQITVSDTGTGIAPDLLAEIFEPFITDKKSGTGLGLTISRDIVIKHRGRITAENNPGRGATFCVTLPLANREIE